MAGMEFTRVPSKGEEYPFAARPSPAAHERRFHFFDTKVLVRSDLPEMLSLLDAMFASFAVAKDGHEGGPEATAELVCSVLAKDGGRAEIRIDGRQYRVGNRRDAIGLGYMVLLQATLRQIRSHLLLHAGALEHRGRGILLAGGSGAGKSTLVFELLRRGFKLLSDDVGAIRLSDGVLEPFPRSLGFVPSGPDRSSPDDQVPSEMRSAIPLIGGGEKLLIRPEALGTERIGHTCPVALLVVLPSGPERLTPGEYLHVVFSELPAGLRDALEALPTISEVEAVPNRLFPELRFRSVSAGRALRQVDAACARFSTAILETSRGDTRAVHSQGTPSLTPLRKSEAARALLRQLHVAQDSAVIQERFGGSGARLLLELARLVEGMRCATLTVGRLADRADRICQALDEIERAEPPCEGNDAMDLSKTV